MALFHKLNRMAKTIGELTNEALETGREVLEASKSVSKIDLERAAADEQFRIIGKHYYNVYISGGEVAQEVAEACETARMHMDAVAAALEEERIRKEEEERARREAELAAQQNIQSGVICPECGAENREGMKFCGECGTKLAVEPTKELLCPRCGSTVEGGMRFCGECGCKMEN